LYPFNIDVDERKKNVAELILLPELFKSVLKVILSIFKKTAINQSLT